MSVSSHRDTRMYHSPGLCHSPLSPLFHSPPPHWQSCSHWRRSGTGHDPRGWMEPCHRDKNYTLDQPLSSTAEADFILCRRHRHSTRCCSWWYASSYTNTGRTTWSMTSVSGCSLSLSYTPVLGSCEDLGRALIGRVVRFGVLRDVTAVRSLLCIWGILSSAAQEI